MEIACVIFGLIQGILILVKRKENWIFYLLNISTLIVYSFSVHLYGDVIENLIYLVIGLFGTLVWSDTSFAKRFGISDIRHSTWKENALFLALIALLSIAIYVIASFTDDPLPILDAVTTGMGFVATYMMAAKIIETWIVWFIDDILMVITYQSLPDPGYFLAVLNFIWIFMAIGSYASWRKEINEKKKYKELEIILPSFACDKHCPYCTAKTTKWPEKEMSIEKLKISIEKMRDFSFIYLTLGGNGEPTLYSLEVLEEIVSIFDDFQIPVKRVLTSGNIFRDESSEKHEMFLNHGWKFEITAAYTDIDKDMDLLGYNHKYYLGERFKNSPILLNYVLLKNNFSNMVQEINDWFLNYSNVERISCKLLNINTRENGKDNPISRWILENAIPKSSRESVKLILDENFEFINHEFDALNYKHPSGKDIHFSWKNGKYGLHDLVWYCDRFVDYHLNSVNPLEV